MLMKETGNILPCWLLTTRPSDMLLWPVLVGKTATALFKYILPWYRWLLFYWRDWFQFFDKKISRDGRCAVTSSSLTDFLIVDTVVNQSNHFMLFHQTSSHLHPWQRGHLSSRSILSWRLSSVRQIRKSVNDYLPYTESGWTIPYNIGT